MKFRYIAILCICILFFLLIGNRFINNHSQLTNGNSKTEAIKVEKVKWKLNANNPEQEVKIYTKSMSVAERDHIRLFIVSDQLKSYKVIEPVYKGNNVYSFKYQFKKKSPYFVSAFLNNQTIDTEVFQKAKEEKQELFPTSILSKKLSDYHVSLLFNSLLPNKNNTLTFQFDQFKSRHPKLSNHRVYIVSEDGTYFKMLSNSSRKNTVKYDMKLPKESMYKLFYEFKINNKNESFSYIIDVKDKDQ